MIQSTHKVIIVIEQPEGINKSLERLIRNFKQELDSAGIVVKEYDPGRQFHKGSALKKILERLIRKRGIPKEVYVDNAKEPIPCHSQKKAGEINASNAKPSDLDVSQPATKSSVPHQISSYYPCETLTINEKGVFLNGQEIHKCTRVDIAKIGTTDYPEVVLHMDMNDIDVKWTIK